MPPCLLSEASDPGRENEDWAGMSSRLIVVVDGATARTETGCTHGAAWYASRLGKALMTVAEDRAVELKAALSTAIGVVAEAHGGSCDLSHPGTPSAAVAVLRLQDDQVQYLVLGDVTVVFQTSTGVQVVVDARVDGTAVPERAEADRHPIGSPEKLLALVHMKHAELAARNRPGGYWVAAADPGVVGHVTIGTVPFRGLRRLAVLTDGAARMVSMFGMADWTGVLDLLGSEGPAEVLRQVRDAEASDPFGRRWARNKRSDDATIVYADALDCLWWTSRSESHSAA